MSVLGKIFGGGSTIGQVGGLVETLADTFTLSDREKLAQYEAETDRLRSQTEINKIEAGHRSLFVAGWRPAVGWICAVAMAYHFIVFPLAGSVIKAKLGFELGDLDWQELSVVLLGMLGFGGLRSFDKMKSANKEKGDSK